jgi:hypothetical protein
VKKRLYLIVSAVVALGVGIYAWSSLGRFTASSLFLVFAAAALAWVLWLVFSTARALTKEPEREEAARTTGRRKKQLEREKQMVLKALKELEFDFKMGKVSQTDFDEISGNYRKRAMRVMRQLDMTGDETDYRKLVERDVATRSKEKKEEEKKPATPKCEKCEAQNEADADFCKKCGARLREEASA